MTRKPNRPRRARPVSVPKAAREMIRRIEESEAPQKPPAPPPTRRLEVDGEPWIARVEGEGTIGHGRMARAGLVAVRFFREDDDKGTVRETYLPKALFDTLYDEELVELMRRARPIEPQSREGREGRADGDG